MYSPSIDFPYGSVVTELPEDFTPPDIWPEYGIDANPFSLCKRELVGTNPRGLRWSLWPLCFEEYFSDSEPDLEKSKEGSIPYNRIVLWKRITRTDIPDNWYQYSKKPSRIDGFYTFKKSEDYRTSWSRIARRHLRMWQNEFSEQYIIEPITLSEFKNAYIKSTVAKKIGRAGLFIIERKYMLPLTRENMIVWGVRNRTTGSVVAGMVVHYALTHKSSVHECPFVLPEGQRVRAMVGLFDHWFSESVRRGVTTQHMTFFWYPGKPKSWKGFSEFKSHFGLQYVAYPPTLIRFVRGKLL